MRPQLSAPSASASKVTDTSLWEFIVIVAAYIAVVRGRRMLLIFLNSVAAHIVTVGRSLNHLGRCLTTRNSVLGTSARLSRRISLAPLACNAGSNGCCWNGPE